MLIWWGCRQLVREGEAQKGYRHRPHALPQHRREKVQERLPDWHPQGLAGTQHCHRMNGEWQGERLMRTGTRDCGGQADPTLASGVQGLDFGTDLQPGMILRGNLVHGLHQAEGHAKMA